MSIEEEDLELKDLLYQALESNGSLAKIRAEVRACTFLALHENETIQAKKPLINNKIKSQLESDDGKLMFQIVHEFLEYFNMTCTKSVFEAESYLGSKCNYENRSKVLSELNQAEDVQFPIILKLIQSCKAKSSALSNGHNEEIKANSEKDQLKPLMLENADNEAVSIPKLPNSDLKDDTYEDTSLIAEDSFKELEKEENSPRAISVSSSINSNSSSKEEKLKKSQSKASRSPSDGNQQKSSKHDSIILPSLYRDENRSFEDENDGMDNYEEDFVLSHSQQDYKEEENSVVEDQLESLSNKMDALKVNSLNKSNEEVSTVSSADFDSSVEAILKSSHSN